MKNGKPQCPECDSSLIWKDGVRRTRYGEVQRYLCRNCGYRFSEPNVKVNVTTQTGKLLHPSADLAEQMISRAETPPKESLDSSLLFRSENIRPQGSKPQHITKVGKGFNIFPRCRSEHRIGASEREAKNSVGVVWMEQRAKSEMRGTELDKATIKGKLVEFAWYMKKEGYRPSTIESRVGCIRRLVNLGVGSHLLDPDKIKEVIAKQESWDDGYKYNLVLAYTTFLTMHNILWQQPRYRISQKLPWIPLKEELDQLIASASKRISIWLQALKETACDPGELHAIEWTDINPQARTITINHPVKGHKPRIIDVSGKLIDRLNMLPKKSKIVFMAKLHSIRRNYQNQRRRASRKFNNPRLLKISFTTFRHWKATMEYHKTKDILWVMKLLGHHSVKTTMIYIDIERAIFKEDSDEFTVRVAENLDEACKLLEVGFKYVTDMEGKKLFRKRK